MVNQGIQDEMLRALYAAYFAHDPEGFNWQLWAEKAGVGPEIAMVNYEELVENELVEGRMGGWASITVKGALEAEAKGLAPMGRLARNEELRLAILRSLALVYREMGRRGFRRLERLIEEAGITEQEFLENQQLLAEVGLIDSIEVGSYRITTAGLAHVEEEDRRGTERDSG